MKYRDPNQPHKCTNCEQEKPPSEFRQDSRYRNGLSSWCKRCAHQSVMEYRLNRKSLMQIRGKNNFKSQGSGNHSAKLEESDIPLIRSLREYGFTYPKIAEKFEVTPAAIGHIIRGKTWTHC